MPRRGAQGNGTIRQRPDGRWEARYVTGYDAGTGKQIRKSVYGSTQKEVRQKLNAAVKALDDGTYTEPSKMTVSQWLDIWLASYMGGVKPRTLMTYTGDIENHIKPAMGAVKLEALNTHTIQTFYNALCQPRGEKKALSPKTIKNIHGCLHKALKQAVMLSYIRFNPSDACTLPRIERQDIKPLDEAQISAFLEAIQGHKYEIILQVVVFTGIRQGEAIGLTWDCVDFTNGTILISKQLQRTRGGNGGYHLVSPKNDRPRTITPAATVMTLLKQQRARQSEWKLRAGEDWLDQRNLVFTDALGNCIPPQTLYANFKRIAAQIGAPQARFHDLRHTFAVMSLQSGDDIKTVQENMGHHTAAFTLDTYIRSTEKMKRDSSDRMEAFIKTVKNL
jgi:Site-specific recombinase XerD